ncbi:MAG: dienelactone hydrolase family protein [Cyclobacteriaceae bacterium]
MIQSEKIEYSNGSDVFEGVIAWDDNFQGKRPVVMVVHNYLGQFEFDENKAIELAKLGYLGFAIDMYGKGRRGNSPEQGQALMGELNANRGLLLERIQLALQTAKELELVDDTKVGGIGFCFGGKCLLDLARSGAEINGIVSFHGVYDKPGIHHQVSIKGSVLICHGWEDPLALPEATVELADELTELKADWQIHAYGHAAHAFTNPKVNLRDEGKYFHEKSDKRSWKSMLNFFEEVFE